MHHSSSVVRLLASIAALFVALSFAHPLAAAPPNDRIDQATGLQFDASSTYFAADISTAGATLEAGEPQPCGDIGATLWYRFEVSEHPWNLVIDSSGSDFDTVVAVYQSASQPYFPSGVTYLGCNHNAGGARAKVTVALTPHRWYFVQAGGAHGATGRLQLSLHCDPACAPISDAMGRYEVPAPASNHPVAVVDVNTAGATMEPDEPRQCGNIGKTVWYRLSWSPPEGIAIDAAGSNFNVVLAVYLVPQGGLSQITPVDCATTAGGVAPRLSFFARGLGQYFIQAGGVDGAGGNLHLEIGCDPRPCPPSGNVVWAPRSAVVPPDLPLSQAIDTTNATNDDGEPTGCGGMSHTVWYQLSSVEPTNIRISTEGSSYDTAIALYLIDFGGPQPPPQLRDWVPQSCSPGGGGERASLQLRMEGHEELVHWYVQIGSRTGNGGALDVQINRGDGTVTIGATPTLEASAVTPTAQARTSESRVTPEPRRVSGITLPDTGSAGLLPLRRE